MTADPPPLYADPASQQRLRTMGIDVHRKQGWLLAGEAAENTGVNKATLWRWAQAGHVRYLQLANGYRMYWPPDLERELAARRQATEVRPDTKE